jgi:hypothetical protein
MRNVKRRRRTLSTSSLASSSTRTGDSPTSSAPGTPSATPIVRQKQWLLDVSGAGREPGEPDERGMTASPMMLPIAEGSGSECEGMERFVLGAAAPLEAGNQEEGEEEEPKKEEEAEL